MNKNKKSKTPKSPGEISPKFAKPKKTENGTFCDVCDKKFRSRYHLKLHMAVHTGEKNYICGICKKGYQQKWNLVTHVARVHSKEKPFKCNDCGKAFGYSSHFKRHVKTHFLEKIEAPDTVKKRILNPYKCHFCEKSFETNYRLELHMRLHTGNRPYVCDKCGKSFTNKRLCVVHIQKKHPESGKQIGETTYRHHSQNGCTLGNVLKKDTTKEESQTDSTREQSLHKKELVPCEICGKTITRASVKKHLNIHYRNRVYSCRYCKKEFLESGQRKVHERKHTGEKPYLCDICGRGHTQYGNLLTHRKRYHDLTGKTPLLWKKNDIERSQTKEKTILLNNQNIILLKSESMPEKKSVATNLLNKMDKSDLKNSACEVTNIKPKYTGNETIEDFIKIASKWVNKKFQELKNSKTVVEINDDLNIQYSEEGEDETPSELFDNSKEKTKEAINDRKVENDMKEEENKNVSVKEVKTRINRIIYEKIVENLRSHSMSAEISQVAEKIKEKTTNLNTDPLREFLKHMKMVPDNLVMKRTDGKTFWHCWLCNSTLKSRHLLARHLIIHEPEENRPYRCEICNKTFTQSNNFKEHTMSHHNENQYYCEKCGSGFRHKSHFNVHMKRHESTTERKETFLKKYECTLCGKKVHTNYQKMEHERTHTKERPYLCKICGQQFGASSTLNRHQSTHTSASHQCTICLKFFRQKSSLKRHYDTHFKYPFNRISCECGKTFSQSPSLKKHKMICKNRIEPIEKPFDCLICSKRFLTKSDLKRHVATHDSSKKYKCSICFTNLKTDETFKRHMRRHDETQNGMKNITDKITSCLLLSELK